LLNLLVVVLHSSSDPATNSVGKLFSPLAVCLLERLGDPVFCPFQKVECEACPLLCGFALVGREIGDPKVGTAQGLQYGHTPLIIDVRDLCTCRKLTMRAHHRVQEPDVLCREDAVPVI